MVRMVAVALLLLLGGNTQPQKAETEVVDSFQDHPCGNPATISSAYLVLRGSSVEVVDIETIVLDLEDPIDLGNPPMGRLRVRLAGVEKPGSRALADSCAADLNHLIEGKVVDVLVNGGSRSAVLPGVPVIIQLSNVEINRWLLEIGCARFEITEDYEVNSWVACDYKRTEEEARDAGLGIWSQMK